MASARRTCFVVSPIGPEGSPIRKVADDLLELAITPALEIFNFQVIRADRIPRPTMITNDIVQLVQEADLCVIDLTGHNPNVYYEAGRRHETGRPAIQVIKQGESIPFDLAGIRTIPYDLDSPRAVHEFIVKLRQYVSDFETTEYGVSSSGASLASMARILERMERKLDAVRGPTVDSRNLPAMATQGLDLPEELLSELPDGLREQLRSTAADPFISAISGPVEKLFNLIRIGEFDQAAALLRKSRSLLSDEKYYFFGTSLAIAGHPAGLEVVLDNLEQTIAKGDDDTDMIQYRLGSAVQYYSGRDLEAEGCEVLDKYFRSALKHYPDSATLKAFVFNQLAKLHSGTGDLELALSDLRKAVELNPNESAYQVNLKRAEAAMAKRLDANKDA